ncbi:MAG: DUF1697 domain-containing protein [Maribacter sp.]
MELETYVAFLRGINVSGQKKVPMASLKKLCEAIGFTQVSTYIQSGNVIFNSDADSQARSENLLSVAIAQAFGFQVPVLVRSFSEIERVLLDNPYKKRSEVETNALYFVFLKSAAEATLLSNLKQEVFTNEVFEIGDRCLYLKCNAGYGKAKLNNNYIERRLKVDATTRNYKTLNKVFKMALK